MRRVSLLKARRSKSQLVESQKKRKFDEGKLEVSELGVIQLEEGEPVQAVGGSADKREAWTAHTGWIWENGI